MKKYKNSIKQTGQALVTLLIFVAIAMTLTGALVVVAVVNSQSNLALGESRQAFTAAESGVENAILELLRNPAYSGSSFIVEENSVVVTTEGFPVIRIVSEGKSESFTKKIEVVVSYNNNVLNIVSWKEID